MSIKQAYARRIHGMLGAVTEVTPQDRLKAYSAVPGHWRHWVMKLVHRNVELAIAETDHGGNDAHVHRLAYLNALPKTVRRGVAEDDVLIDANDIVAVQKRFGDLRKPALESPTTADRMKPLTYVMGIGVLSGAAAWFFLIYDPYARWNQPRAESPQAFITGGRPLAGAANVRQLFEQAIPQFVIAVDRLRREFAMGTKDVETARAQAQQEATTCHALAETAVGADVASFVRAILDQGIEVVTAEPGEGDAADSFVRTVDALNRVLAEHGYAYYLDSQVINTRGGGSMVVLASYVIEQVSLLHAPETDARVLRIRRLDTLNTGRNLLGMTRAGMPYGLVLLNTAEESFVSYVGAALGYTLPDPANPVAGESDVRPIRLVGDSSREPDPSWIVPFEQRLAGHLHAEMMALVDESMRDEVAEFGGLLRERTRLIERMSDDLQRTHQITLRQPETVELELNNFFGRDRVSTRDWEDLERVQAGLMTRGSATAFRLAWDHYLQFLEHIEVRHRLDMGEVVEIKSDEEGDDGEGDSGESSAESIGADGLPADSAIMHDAGTDAATNDAGVADAGAPTRSASERITNPPEALITWTGSLIRWNGVRSQRAHRAAVALSAHLAELITTPEMFATNLIMLSAHAFNPRRSGSGEAYAALMLIEALAQEMHLEIAPLAPRRRIVRANGAAALLAVLERPLEERRRAALALWARYYGGEPGPLRR